MRMKLGDLLAVMSCKDGDELFAKVTELLRKIEIQTTYCNGEVKDLRTLCYEVSDVLNSEKSGGK